MDAICSTYVYMKDYKFSQVLLESQEIKSVVRVVADRIFKMMSRKVEKNFEVKWSLQLLYTFQQFCTQMQLKFTYKLLFEPSCNSQEPYIPMLQGKKLIVLFSVEVRFLPMLSEGTFNCEFVCEPIALKILQYIIEKICIVKK